MSKQCQTLNRKRFIARKYRNVCEVTLAIFGIIFAIALAITAGLMVARTPIVDETPDGKVVAVYDGHGNPLPSNEWHRVLAGEYERYVVAPK